MRKSGARWCWKALATVGAVVCGLQANAKDHASVVNASGTGVEIRRTTDGIPHVRARSWRGLGHGVGYAQAEDALCTLAEGFVTYEGRRSRFFGPDAKPARASSFGQPQNLELDVFFRVMADAEIVERYKAQQPSDFAALIDGFASGYNHYLADARRGILNGARPACLNQAWVREIIANDIYRRLIAAGFAAGYATFIPEIVNAKPPNIGAGSAQTIPSTSNSLQALFAHRIGNQPGIGSNAIALGRRATGEEGGVLLGNPHWYWGGPDRFYQMHLSIPGRLDVAGAAFLGVPVVMIGFNQHVAWSHTVSEARRFGLFDLTLDPADPTQYRVDGKIEKMQPRHVAVEVNGKGGVRRVTRTLYRTRFGYVVDFGGRDPAFGWSASHAIAIRDINGENFRTFRNFFHWNQAKSLDEFIAIQRREAAMPWVNTLAIGRGDGRVWYADIGAVPHVPDALRKSCATPLSIGFAQVDAITPFLDGSRAACDWRVDAAAVQTSAMPPGAMPSLLREDYVVNMNDSYWLTQPAQLLEGYPIVLGGEREPQSLRSRLGHRIAQGLVTSREHSSLTVSRRLMRDALHPRVYSAELFKDELLATACLKTRKAELIEACEVLRRWKNTGDANDRGALLWDAFWSRVQAIPAQELYRDPFSSSLPLVTPAQANGSDPRVITALTETVAAFRKAKLALDTPLGARRYVRTDGEQLRLYGGCHDSGYFTVVCNDDGSDMIGLNSVGNSYIQVVRFTAQGVEAHTLLAHGERETAIGDGPGSAPVRRYARKNWLHFPFSETEIARDPALRRTVVLP